ncbi:hypothetical protein FE257_006628 [Aspergillus nanangensis]|uniref:UBL3-like ubiquitin domain-containing protein n=1 Tax=Aspergillus nanangensis TaxID=2582783 RepID=A0AAD4CZL7_ASPNN|nr:hypothetical protein FE257_006628 [Aspergillus nanangensis]
MASSDHPPPDPSALQSNNEESAPATAVATGAPQESHPQPTELPAIPAQEPIETLNSSAQSNNNAPQETPVTRPIDAQPSASTPMAAKQEDTDTAPQSTDAPSTDPTEQKTETLDSQQSAQSSDASAKEVEDSGPSLVITLLLITGSRHPFKIDGKYLRKRSVNVENYDPFAMSVYTLKELIWREWRQDWEPRPASPSSIRLISFGKLLDDKAPLSDSKFNRDAPNVVHMTVKPQELIDEEDAKGAKTQYTREREASERSPGCRCVIQ